MYHNFANRHFSSKAPYHIEKALGEVKKVYWAVWNEKGHASFSLCTSRGVSECQYHTSGLSSTVLERFG